MQRRGFVTSAAVGAAATGLLAAPAYVRAQPAMRWRMPSSFPKALDTVWGNAEMIASRVRELTDGKFEISASPAGELVPPLQVLDAVQEGTTECGHTAGFYYAGKDPALVFDTGLPFGLTPRQHNAWLKYGGGMELMREIYGRFNVVQIPAGNTGAQMGGWFSKPIKTVADLKGLRIRTPGFLGQVYSKLGAVPQQIAGGDVYTSLEKGTIDAVEWVGPYDDEKLGFHKVASHYYGPGVMELGASLCFIVNKGAWERLPAHYRAALESACSDASIDMLAKYDARNIQALKRLVGLGAKVTSWPVPVMKAMQKATEEVIKENAAKSPSFSKVLANWAPFKNDQMLWSSINDGAAERFLHQNRS
ncbi:MAG: TRAP transporter substrate-binding protein DctP [Hydrogenophaga sp.]|uniref:TRAP transporter substrate-binding protein n=1 Tax=Hydrogenophaga sp. TaxID=1904254 RepID=UPI002733B596|nr:TRAP transporter substrate-binding protein DctP [Hydrogenophaga sp.]MDP3625399.1 TRAP transporter substrate-binding protein DctP [Hydrogenophaga sp.]